MPWHGQPSTKIEVELEPFEFWFDFDPNRPLLNIQLGPNREPAQVLRLAPPTLGQGGNSVLEVLGHIDPADADTGKWFWIDGRRDRLNAAQSGTWTQAASGSNGATFKLHDYAWLSGHMLGWMLQPDVNVAVYLPITEVNPQQHTVAVGGNYKSLGQPGKRWRIFAPPGASRTGAEAGMLDKWVAASSSRCLYNGYRYESPLAGLPDWTTTGASSIPPVVARQAGTNFAGRHYTLHRHYDPVLMRFTSPDPLASPFYNLHHYVGNSPAAYYDPDGLELTEYGKHAKHQAENAKEGWGWLAQTLYFFDRLSRPEKHETSARYSYEDNVREIRRKSEALGAETPLERAATLPLVLFGHWLEGDMNRRYMIKTGMTPDGQMIDEIDRRFLMVEQGHQNVMTALTFASMTVGMPVRSLSLRTMFGRFRRTGSNNQMWTMDSFTTSGRASVDNWTVGWRTLPQNVRSAFAGGQAAHGVTQTELTLVRVSGGNAGPVGRFMAPAPYSSRAVGRDNMALLHKWNSMTREGTVRIPPGVEYYYGTVGAQTVRHGRAKGKVLPGGGGQYFFPHIDKSWFSKTHRKKSKRRSVTDGCKMVDEYKIPAGVEYYVGAPSEATSERFLQAIKDALATVSGVKEAHLPLFYVVGISPKPELVLVIVPDDTRNTSSVRVQTIKALSSALMQEDEVNVLLLDGEDAMMKQIRTTGRQIA